MKLYKSSGTFRHSILFNRIKVVKKTSQSDFRISSLDSISDSSLNIAISHSKFKLFKVQALLYKINKVNSITCDLGFRYNLFMHI